MPIGMWADGTFSVWRTGSGMSEFAQEFRLLEVPNHVCYVAWGLEIAWLWSQVAQAALAQALDHVSVQGDSDTRAGVLAGGSVLSTLEP